MRGIIGVLFSLLFVLLPVIVKVREGAKGAPPRPRPAGLGGEEEALETSFAEEDEGDVKMQKTRSEVPNEPEYFTYETVAEDERKPGLDRRNCPSEMSQSVENETESAPELTFTEDEIYKGVIYSEILKKKYN